MPSESELAVAEGVISSVLEVYRIPREVLMGRSRREWIVEARFVACYVLRDSKFMSFPAIGAVMGRDHSTVIHACNSAVMQARSNVRMRERIDQVRMLSCVRGFPCTGFVAGYIDERPIEFLEGDRHASDSCARIGCGWMRGLHAAELRAALPAPMRRAA